MTGEDGLGDVFLASSCYSSVASWDVDGRGVVVSYGCALVVDAATGALEVVTRPIIVTDSETGETIDASTVRFGTPETGDEG